MPVTYKYEYSKKLRTGFIGCGGQAYRNIYPTFQYAPVNLVAVCDLDPALAANCAKILSISPTRLLEGKGPEYGTLDDALELLQLYEAYLQPDQMIHRVGKL